MRVHALESEVGRLNVRGALRLEQTLGLGDTMDITKLDGGTEDILSCNVEEVPLDGKNLIVKGFDLFRQRTGSSVPHTRAQAVRQVM